MKQYVEMDISDIQSVIGSVSGVPGNSVSIRVNGKDVYDSDTNISAVMCTEKSADDIEENIDAACRITNNKYLVVEVYSLYDADMEAESRSSTATVHAFPTIAAANYFVKSSYDKAVDAEEGKIIVKRIVVGEHGSYNTAYVEWCDKCDGINKCVRSLDWIMTSMDNISR